MRKRIGILSLAVVVLLSLGIALGGAAKTQVTLTFFHMNTIPEAQKAITEAIKAFEAKNPGVKIKETLVDWGSAHAQFLNSLVAGQAPDLAMLGGTWAVDFRRMGAFAPIDQLASKGFLDIFLPVAFAAVKADGHVYGVPWEGATWAFFYRKDLFEKAGLDPNRPPANWDELLAYAQKLTKGDQYGLVMPAAGWEPADYFLPFMWQAGCPVEKFENGKWYGAMNNEAGRKATQFYVDLVRKYKVVPETITGMDWEGAKNAFVAGKAAMMYNGMWVVNVIRNSNKELEGKWATAINPAGPTGIKAALGYPNTLHITAQSKNKKLAMKFIELFYTNYNNAPSYADKYAQIVGSLNWTKKFVSTAYPNDPLFKPFIDSMEFSHYPPFAPKWQDFLTRTFNPGIQALILGRADVEETLKKFDQEFNELHGSK
ncbi:MAG: ABC transporter substrate-binding protein [Bacillota bacterium]